MKVLIEPGDQADDLVCLVKKLEVKIKNLVPWSNAFWPGLTPFGPPMWQAEADKELTLSALPVTAVGQSKLAQANLG